MNGLVNRVLAIYFWLHGSVGASTSKYSDSHGAKKYGNAPRLWDFLCDVGLSMRVLSAREAKAIRSRWRLSELEWFATAKEVEARALGKESRESEKLSRLFGEAAECWKGIRAQYRKNRIAVERSQYYKRAVKKLTEEFIDRKMLWVMSDGGLRLMIEVPEAPNEADLLKMLKEK